MLISNNRPIMGEHCNGRLAATLGWATFTLMAAAAVTTFTVGAWGRDHG